MRVVKSFNSSVGKDAAFFLDIHNQESYVQTSVESQNKASRISRSKRAAEKNTSQSIK